MRLTRDDYARAYSLLAELTPLKGDCGNLCNKACCSGVPEDAGMYLYPGEEVLFDGTEPWCSVEPHLTAEREFCPSWDGRIDSVGFLRCEGTCPRGKRPLACRLFPLAADPVPVPVGADGKEDYSGRPVSVRYEMGVVLDSDAALLCPLARKADVGLLDPGFVEACRKVFEILAKDEMILKDMCWQAERRREDARAPWRRLLED